MSKLCSKKDMFGKPGEGVHAYRFAGVAVVDLAMTAAAAAALAKWQDKSFIMCFFALMILAVFMHKLFCVETALNKKLNI